MESQSFYLRMKLLNDVILAKIFGTITNHQALSGADAYLGPCKASLIKLYIYRYLTRPLKKAC